MQPENIESTETEKQKWKDILSRLLDITLFLAKQNLAFRGHNSTKRNILQLVQLLSKYDEVLKEHILNLEHSKFPKVSHLSPAIQNKFISVLLDQVKSKLVNEIESAKYFSIMFNSIPDISHVHKMSEVIRYVKTGNRKVEVKEALLGIFALEERQLLI